MTKTVVTAALPYANGYLHIGHLLEYLQADIFTRFLKLIGEEALYICAADMHGTPVEVNALKAGKKPEEFAKFFLKEQKKDFESFLIKFDNYYKTHSEENKELALHFFNELKKKDLIYTKESEQMYDEKEKRFLPDRFIKGNCPKCKAEDQYGDICEKCGSTYSPEDLIDPYSTVSNSKPIMKKTTHYYFKLSKLSKDLEKWLNNPKSGIQREIKNWLNNWIKEGLRDWCISRDEPYFGFEIPNSKKETGAKKFFYVWLDAPIGYISSTKNYCDKKKCNWEDYWYKGNVHHIIGKDIVYFHYLFWPAMLKSVGIPIPKMTTHGFITVNGEKMSKSRGTFFTIADFRKLYHPESLRFFYASHIDRKVVDIDLNLKDFQAVTNNVLMGNLGNYCYRTFTFAEKNYGEIKEVAEEKKLTKEINSLLKEIKQDYQEQNFKKAVKNILKISDLGNSYFQNSEPWKDKEKKQAIVGYCINLARNLAIISSPILPEFSDKVYSALGEKKLSWEDISFEWKGEIKKPEMLVEKIDVEKNETPEEETFPLSMKVGKILEIKDHPNADSLYLFKVDFADEKRQVVAGLKKYFKPEDLLNKKTAFCMNLKKAKLRGELSEAMILVADDEKNLSLLDIGDAEPGTPVEFSGLKGVEKEVSYGDFQKIKMVVKGKGIIYEGKKLLCKEKPVTTSGVKEGAYIC